MGIDSIEEILDGMSHLLRCFDGKVFPVLYRNKGNSIFLNFLYS